MDAKAISKEAITGRGEPVSLSVDSDFTFDGLTTQTAEGLNDRLGFQYGTGCAMVQV